MSKVIENFRNHPSLKYDPIQLVFKIEQKTYLIRESTVREITPKKVVHTNIGEPYASLVRLNFVFANETYDQYEESVDFSPEHESELLEAIA